MWEWPWESRKSVKNILAVDLGTASISAAIAEKPLQGKPKVIKVLRYRFDLLQEGAYKHDTQIFMGGMRRLLTEAQNVSHDIDHILLSFSDPLFSEKRVYKKVERKPPYTPIVQSEIDDVTRSIEKAIIQENESLIVASSKIAVSSVNGYPVDSVLKYRGKFFEIETQFTLVNRSLKEHIEELQKSFFPRAEMVYHSDTRVLHKALQETGNTYEPAIVIDIGGEVTSVFFVNSDEIEHLGLVMFGVRTLERRIASYFKTDISGAESIMHKYTAGSIDTAKQETIENLISSALEDWWLKLQDPINKSPLKFSKSIISGGGAVFPVFLRIIKEKFSGLPGIGELNIQALRAEAFRDLFESINFLSGGRDVILISLILYHA